ncbi:PIN domain-containing protein [archaeon]|nr:PIN domain-containing protein [archaeon]
MILIIDANVLFSALIKNSLTAELIFEEELILSTPEFIIAEFLKYEDIILEKTHRTKEEFIQIRHMLKDIITLVPKEEYAKFIEKAEKFSPDLKDTLYLALALKLKCAVWSNDKKIRNQNKVRIYSTGELKKELNL